MKARKLLISTGIAAMAILVAVAGVSAAGPNGTGAANGDTDRVRAQDHDQLRDRDTIAGLLGLTQAEIQAQRAAGKSLAQIATAKGIDPEKLVAALVARWTERIQARLENGTIDAARATELKLQVETQARNQVYKVIAGGMAGAAVGAGIGAHTGRGMGLGNGDMDRMRDGTCDPAGNGQRARSGS